MFEYDGYVLREYRIHKAKLVKENKKTYTVSIPPEPMMKYRETLRVSKDKYIPKATPFCLVWEMWKGVNGRGGYRLETTAYPEALAIGGNKVSMVHEEDNPND
jgi:hypothetical protein